MHNLRSERTGLTLPKDVKPEMVIDALAKGHGYKWMILARHPILLAYGEPALGDMPQLLFTSRTTLIVSEGDPIYVERLRRLLEILGRQEENQTALRESRQS